MTILYYRTVYKVQYKTPPKVLLFSSNSSPLMAPVALALAPSWPLWLRLWTPREPAGSGSSPLEVPLTVQSACFRMRANGIPPDCAECLLFNESQ